jgi:hypothetical protein
MRWHGPLRTAADMPLGVAYPNSVVFVCEDREDGRTPIGTAFLIQAPVSKVAGRVFWRYAVTARHVVEHGRQTWLRLQRRDGGAPEEVAISEWVQHPTADIAVAPWDDFSLGTDEFGRVGFERTFIGTDDFADRVSFKVGPGEVVYTIGLLSDLRSMTDRSIPMVRGGRLGAMYQTDIPVRQGEFSRIEPSAHLIDVYSQSGFSGAPCIVEQLSVNVAHAAVFPYLALLGVVTGHFDTYSDVLSKQGEGEAYETDFRVKDNQGVAVVIPIEAVREVLGKKQDTCGRSP